MANGGVALLMCVLQVQSGTHPKAADVSAVRELFCGPPLGVTWMTTEHKVSGPSST